MCLSRNDSGICLGWATRPLNDILGAYYGPCYRCFREGEKIGFEDLTTYNKVDTESKLTVDALEIDFREAHENVVPRLWKQFSKPFRDIDLKFKMGTTSYNDTPRLGIAFTDETAEDITEISADDSGFSLFEINAQYIRIISFDGGGVSDSYDAGVEGLIGNTYYIHLYNELAELYAKIYSDSDFSTLLDTIHVTGTGNPYYYFYPFITGGDAATDWYTGIMGNYDLHLGSPWHPNYRNARFIT